MMAGASEGRVAIVTGASSGIGEATALGRARAPGAADYSIYVAFEGAFLLADGWVAVASLAGAAGLWRMRDWGLLFTLLGAGAGLFLGLIDLLYDLEHGMYVPLSGNAALELAIVAGLLILCPLTLPGRNVMRCGPSPPGRQAGRRLHAAWLAGQHRWRHRGRKRTEAPPGHGVERRDAGL
jgi:hypothetical protein